MISASYQAAFSTVRQQPPDNQSFDTAAGQVPLKQAASSAYGTSVTGIARIICTARSRSLGQDGVRSGTTEISTYLRSGKATRIALFDQSIDLFNRNADGDTRAQLGEERCALQCKSVDQSRSVNERRGPVPDTAFFYRTDRDVLTQTLGLFVGEEA